jgi:hypothetical protein
MDTARSAVAAAAAVTDTAPASSRKSAGGVCEFCDIEVPLSALADHVRVCSSRTDVCDACLCYVRLRDMADHRRSGCAFGATASAVTTVDGESTPLLMQQPPANEDGHARHEGGPWRTRLAVRDPDQVPRWAPVAVAAVGAIAAAAVFSTLRRRR